jgi:hypothetical protein
MHVGAGGYVPGSSPYNLAVFYDVFAGLDIPQRDLVSKRYVVFRSECIAGRRIARGVTFGQGIEHYGDIVVLVDPQDVGQLESHLAYYAEIRRTLFSFGS